MLSRNCARVTRLHQQPIICCRAAPSLSSCDIFNNLHNAETNTSLKKQPYTCSTRVLLSQQQQQQQRRVKSPHTAVLPLSDVSLGLAPSLVDPVVTSISQLPEVKAVLLQQQQQQQLDSSSAKVDFDSLTRAVDIFARMQPNGPEHLAVLTLMAELQQQQGNYANVLKILDNLQDLVNVEKSPRQYIDLILARAKVLWLQGDFVQSMQLCDDLVGEESGFSLSGKSPIIAALESLPLHYAAAKTGQAVCRLLLAESLDDAFVMRDPARSVVKRIETYHNAALPLVAANLNFGIAEFTYARLIQRLNKVDPPFNAALRAWRNATTMLKQHDQRKPLVGTLMARLNTNIAVGILQMSQDPDHIKQATDFASKALAVYDKSNKDSNRDGKDDKNDTTTINASSIMPREGMTRVLTLIAQCYHKSGSAVTAEGLLQTAITPRHVTQGTLELLQLREAYQAYANLCNDWEKRESDGQKYQGMADKINAELPLAWQNKSSMHASLWFWTPYLFV